MKHLLTQQKILKSINDQLSSINGLPGKSFSKSQSRVIMDTDSVDSLIVNDPFLIQNSEMWPAPCNRLHLDQKVFYKKGALKNFAKFTGKRLCQSLFFDKVAGLGEIPLAASV